MKMAQSAAHTPSSSRTVNLRLEMVGTRSTASPIFSRNGDAVERIPTGFTLPDEIPGSLAFRGRAVAAPFPFLNQCRRQDASARVGYIVVLACLAWCVLCVVGVTGYFRLSSETAVLSSSLRKAVPGTWHKKIAVNVGGFTMAVVRHGVRFFRLEPEPRAAVEALRGAEVGIYDLKQQKAGVPDASVLLATDNAMKARGWDRVVGVAEKEDLVAVYMPRKGLSARKMKCCVMVLHGTTLVVASARGNVEPLLAIARDHLERRTERRTRLSADQSAWLAAPKHL